MLSSNVSESDQEICEFNNSRSNICLDDNFKERTLSELGYKIEKWNSSTHYPIEKLKLYNLMREQIEKRIKTDLTVKIDGYKFETHLMVLQCYSRVFMDIDGKVSEVELPSDRVTPNAFRMLYDWMLNDKACVRRINFLELLSAAEFLGVMQFCSQCWTCLDDNLRLSEGFGFMLYWESKKFNMDNFNFTFLSRITKFFNTLVASAEWFILNESEIHALISSSNIGVNSEIEVFYAVIRWLNHDWSKRSQFALNLVKAVRFQLVPPFQMGYLESKLVCPDVQRIIDVRGVRELMHDGIVYSATKIVYGKHRKVFSMFVEQNNFVEQMPRVWLYDSMCKYHHRRKCENICKISYNDYIEYLHQIQTMTNTHWQSHQSARFGTCRCGLVFSDVTENDNLTLQLTLDSSDSLSNTDSASYRTEIIEEPILDSEPTNISDSSTSEENTIR